MTNSPNELYYYTRWTALEADLREQLTTLESQLERSAEIDPIILVRLHTRWRTLRAILHDMQKEIPPAARGGVVDASSIAFIPDASREIFLITPKTVRCKTETVLTNLKKSAKMTIPAGITLPVAYDQQTQQYLYLDEYPITLDDNWEILTP